MYITLSFDCEEDETRILKLLLLSKAFILEKIDCKLIIYMLQWILGFLGIAWPSPVTVDLLLCNMNLLYEENETLKFFEELLGPTQAEHFFFFLLAYI